MKNIYFANLLLCILLSVILAGCSNAREDIESTIADTEKIDNSDANTNEQGETASEAVKNAVSANLKDYAAIQGAIYASDNTLLFITDSLLLLSTQDLSKIAEVEISDYVASRIWKIADGYVLIGDTQTSEGSSQMIIEDGDTMTVDSTTETECVFYDEYLQKYNRIVLNPIFGDKGFLGVDKLCVSSDGDKIAFNAVGKIYIYSIREAENVLLLEINVSEEQNGLSAIQEMKFVEDDTVLAFVGQSFHLPLQDNANSFCSYGKIDIATGSVENYHLEGYEAQSLQVAQNRMLISEDTTSTGSGYAVLYEMADREFIHFEEQGESTNACLSSNGTYIGTFLRKKNTGWTFKLYDTADNQIVYEEEISFASEAEYRDPVAMICEESRKIYIVVKPASEEQENVIMKYDY